MLRAGGAASKILIADNTSTSNVLSEIRRRARAAAIPVRMVPRAEVDRIA